MRKASGRSCEITVWLLALLSCAALHGATFGNRVPVNGGPLDLVLDERRNQLYLVDFNTNAVQVYSLPGRRFLPSIRVGTQPVSGAMSLDGKFLYVTSFGSASLSIVDLNQNAMVRSVTLPAPPEGLAVGADGRVLITTLGLGAGANRTDTLVIFNPDAAGQDQLTSVVLPPTPPTPPQLPPVVAGRPYLSFRGRLQATPDGSLIIGMNTPTNASTIVFVYEVASGQVLRSRLVPNASTVLSVSPDGKRFMAGLRLFDTATLNVLANQDANNAPFPIQGNFNTLQNFGGSVFSPDGSTLYSAFNIAPFSLPTPRPNSTTLLLNNPRNLAIKMGIQLPESILGKMVSSSDGSNVYALSESGFLILPVGTMNSQPILMPESTVVRLSANQCERGAASRTLRINNAGRGALRYTVNPIAATAGLTAQQDGILAPGTLRLGMNPATSRRLGSTSTLMFLVSPDAINVPPVIQIYQNWTNAENRNPSFAVETTNFNTTGNPEGLVDLLVDNLRQRVYIANSGKNQVEVFDIRQQAFQQPIEVGQFPRSMAFGTDGRTLYVANSGGEWISMVDLDQGKEYDRVKFPPAPFNALQAPVTPRVIAQGVYGLQIWASTAANAAGQLWSTSGTLALPRQISNAIGTLNIPAPVSMAATPDNNQIMLLSGNGTAYLYDSLADDYVLARPVMSAPINSYYGAVAAGPEGRYFLANRAILNSTLVPMGGYAGGTPIQVPNPTGGQQPGGGGPGGGGPGGGGAFPFPVPGGGGGVIIIVGGGGGGLPGPGQIPPGGGGGNQVQLTPGLRNVPAVAPVNATNYARFSTPQQANATAQPTGDPQPLIELVDINTEQVMGSAPVSEGPVTSVFGNARANIPGRLMGVDNRAANAYVVTATGLSMVSLAVGRQSNRITVNPRAVVQGASYTTPVAPGSLISVFGQNMADAASAGSLPLPTMLGGTCVTFNDTSIPLVMTSSAQINAQVPPNLRPGNYSVTVRSPQNALGSNAVQVSVAAAAPGVFANTSTGEASLFHADDLTLVTADHPARRDEQLVLFATGMPPSTGVNLQPGAASPLSPLATTVHPKVFIGDTRVKEAEMIVLWSGFTPGFVGLNQINIRVPGAHVKGSRLPVTIEVGNVSSPRTGPVVPVTYVE